MIATIVAGAVVVLAAAAWGFYWMIGRPMFEPGTVAARKNFDVPAQNTEAWRVTEEVTLHHLSAGAGAEIIFIHGGPGFPPERLSRTAEALADNFRVHLYHQRGCGKSTRPFREPPPGSFYEKLRTVEDQLGLAEQIADIERIRRILGREQVTLVGHSFGALIAALYAAEFPKNVRALILVAPAPLFTMPPASPDLFAQIRARLPEERRAKYDAYFAKYFDLKNQLEQDEAALSKYFGELRTFYAEAVGLRSPIANDGDAGGFLTVALFAGLGRRHDWSSALAEIRAPTLVLHGAGDLLPEAESQKIAAAIPGAKLITVPNASHFLLDEAPEAAAAAIRDHLR